MHTIEATLLFTFAIGAFTGILGGIGCFFLDSRSHTVWYVLVLLLLGVALFSLLGFVIALFVLMGMLIC